MRALIAAALALALVGAACGDDDDTSDALSAVCDQEEAVLEDLVALRDLDPAANTASDYRSAVDELTSAVEDLGAAREELAEQDVDNVSQAYDDLRSELQDLDDVPLSEVRGDAAAAVQAQIQALVDSYETAYANSSCAPAGGEDE